MRIEMLWNGGNMRTTKEIEDDMSGPDMDMMTAVYDVLVERENKRRKGIINHGVWGEK